MLAGTLDRRITILRRVQTGKNKLNEPVFDWQPVRRTWASKVDKENGEAFDPETKQRYARQTTIFKTRYREVFVTDKIVCEGTEYDVKGVSEIGRHEGVEISSEAQL